MSENRTKSKSPCFAFQKGECKRGDQCLFSHDPPEQKTAETGPGLLCTFCDKKGHLIDACSQMRKAKKTFNESVKMKKSGKTNNVDSLRRLDDDIDDLCDSVSGHSY